MLEQYRDLRYRHQQQEDERILRMEEAVKDFYFADSPKSVRALAARLRAQKVERHIKKIWCANRQESVTESAGILKVFREYYKGL